MASLIQKQKANTLYYYVVESARVDSKASQSPAGFYSLNATLRKESADH
jgi:hypothetical protein